MSDPPLPHRPRAVSRDGAAGGSKPRRATRAVSRDGAASGPKPQRATRAPDADAATSTTTTTRIAARDLGIRAERAAQAYLLDRGFAILGTNVRVGRYEIDLLARDQAVVVVVEVRARGPGSLLRPLDTVDGRKRTRLRIAARHLWRDRFARDLRIERLRFDCIAVTIDAAGEAHIEHVRAAF